MSVILFFRPDDEEYQPHPLRSTAVDTGPVHVQIGKKLFDLVNPKAHDFDLREAVAAIARIPRFAGHGPFYSVAQHCVTVSSLCARPWDGLAHDLAEAYYGDITTPMKRLIKRTSPPLRSVLDRIDKAVENAFMFSSSHPEVRRADQAVLEIERKSLLPELPLRLRFWWPLSLEPAPFTIIPLSPEDAEQAWWDSYHTLLEQRRAPTFPYLTKNP